MRPLHTRQVICAYKYMVTRLTYLHQNAEVEQGRIFSSVTSRTTMQTLICNFLTVQPTSSLK